MPELIDRHRMCRRDFTSGIAGLTAMAATSGMREAAAAESSPAYRLYCPANGSIDVRLSDLAYILFDGNDDVRVVDLAKPSNGKITILSFDRRDYSFRYTPSKGWIGRDYINLKLIKKSQPYDVKLYFDVNKHWWKSSPPNGRSWASGPFHWSYDWLAFYGRKVAIPTAICANASGKAERRAATWELMAGGPKGRPSIITPGSQMDWSNRGATCWAAAWDYMPKNQGIMAMAFCMVPESHRSDRHPDSWRRIASGEFDQYYVDMGARLARNHANAGRDLKHWFGRPNHEMNQTNIYQVFSSNRLQYKAAMERAFTLMRKGANYPLRWCHAPAPVNWIGPFEDWIPDNCDALALSYHPAYTVVDRKSWLKFMNGTSGKRYGFSTDLIRAADRRGKPIAFPEWSPRYESGRGCPIADQVLQWTYDELFMRYQDRLVCECVHHPNTLIKGSYQDNQRGGSQAWDRAVDLYPRLWGGSEAS